MPTSPECTRLLSGFLQQLGVPDDGVKDASALEFEHEGLILRMFPHFEKPLLLVDVVILIIDPAEEEARKAERLHTLHRLNALARLSHGAVASLTPDDELLISRALDLRVADSAALMDCFNDLIGRARTLRDSWQHLGDLLSAEQTGSGARGGPHLQHQLA